MIEPRDFTVGCCGCLLLIVCIALVPVIYFVFKISLCVALLIGVIVLALVGVAFLGKVIRRIFT